MLPHLLVQGNQILIWGQNSEILPINASTCHYDKESITKSQDLFHKHETTKKLWTLISFRIMVIIVDTTVVAAISVTNT